MMKTKLAILTVLSVSVLGSGAVLYSQEGDQPQVKSTNQSEVQKTEPVATEPTVTPTPAVEAPKASLSVTAKVLPPKEPELTTAEKATAYLTERGENNEGIRCFMVLMDKNGTLEQYEERYAYIKGKYLGVCGALVMHEKIGRY